jgi:hypothetical protein
VVVAGVGGFGHRVHLVGYFAWSFAESLISVAFVSACYGLVSSMRLSVSACYFWSFSLVFDLAAPYVSVTS